MTKKMTEDFYNCNILAVKLQTFQQTITTLLICHNNEIIMPVMSVYEAFNGATRFLVPRNHISIFPFLNQQKS